MLGRRAADGNQRDHDADRDRNKSSGETEAPARTRAERGALQGSGDLTPRGAFGRMDLHDSDRLLEPLQPLDATEPERDAVRCAGELANGVGRQHLPGARKRAQPRGPVERSAPEAAVHGNGLAGIETDPDGQRQVFVHDRVLKSKREAQSLPGRIEHHQCLVPPQLLERARMLRRQALGQLANRRARAAPASSPCWRVYDV